MNNKIISAVISQGILPLYFHKEEEISIQVLHALYEAGIRIVEYTNRGPEALRNFEKMKRAAVAGMPGMMLALGTVMDAPTARTAVNIGADFIISPGFVEDVEKYTRENHILWIPGCMTPTDIIRARAAAITMVKLFPGNLLGPDFMRAIRDLFPDMLFMPTGGVVPQKENLSDWFSAGVSAVGMGSTLISKAVTQKKDYPAITRITREVMAMIKEIRAAD
jgi:2-dehydro-3-deoxyphosphogluconate aldolase/(4S)-4-hydroxy-2-oxoglutarate aldolase